jgi:PBP1b-binding outer membrane lipoprotein LpoB
MKKINKLILLNFILIILTSCTSIKEGLTNQKKKSSDEFFVQKKSPLTMPPSYGELPTPKSQKISKGNENEVQNLIGKSKDKISQADKSNNQNKNLTESILGKIKNN